jgi:hypothetical protein
MIEIERQVGEAPPVCVIVQCNKDGRAWVERFEDEDGTPIAWEKGEVYADGSFVDTSQEFTRLMSEYAEEIDAALDFARKFHRSYYTAEDNE